MSALATRWSELLIAGLSEGEHLTAAARGSLLRPPATEAEIQEAEARLGCTLPPSYREFLLVSNGAYGDDYGPKVVYDRHEPEEPRPESPIVGVGFLPVQDVKWLRDVMPWYVDIFNEGPQYQEAGPVTEDQGEIRNWTPFSRGLIIATDKHPGTTVLVPFDGLDDWQMWNVHKETTTSYLSFRSFLEYQVRQREPVSTVTEFEALLGHGTTSDVATGLRLAHIGTPEAVAVLMKMEPQAARSGLIALRTQEARDLLFAREGVFALKQTGDPRTAEVAAKLIGDLDPTQPIRPHDLLSLFPLVSQTRDPRYIPVLMPFYERGPSVSFNLLTHIAFLGAPEALARLRKIADSGSGTARQAQQLLQRLDETGCPTSPPGSAPE